MQIDFATKEDIARLEEKLDAVLALVSVPKTVKVSDICKKLNMCSSTLRYDFPWLLPNFGVSQYPGVAKWDVSVWEEWNARPVEDRKKEYMAHVTDRARRCTSRKCCSHSQAVDSVKRVEAPHLGQSCGQV